MPDGFNFDFNHGAQRDVNDPASRDLSERINAHIDAAFFAKREAEPPREYVGASAIGNECLRAVQMGFAGVKPDEGRITGRTLRIFQTGHVFEDEIAKWLQWAGFELEVIDPETKKQFGFSVLDDDGQGHLDGILRGGPIPMQYPCVWECKALNDKSWQDVKKRGLAISKPIYAGQVAINQAYLELTNPGLFTALNKNTSEIHHELVPFDQPLAQNMSDKMAQVVEATRNQQLLPRAYKSPDFYKCKFCDFQKSCWSLPR
jgi:hypothetical protein